MSGHWIPINISQEQWENLLLDNSVFYKNDIKLMLALYNSNCCTERASVLAEMVHANNYQTLNAQVIQLGKRIVKKMPNIKYPTILDDLPVARNMSITDLPIMYTFIPFQGEDDDENSCHFYWILRIELQNALKKLIDIDVINNDEPAAYEISNDQAENLYEGAKKKIIVNAYERNRKARNICIKKYGYKCSVCGFDFEKKYGKIGRNFIEVHHIKPLNEINKSYRVDPIADLRPVCPNCHAMLHRADITIEELKKVLKE